MAGAHSNAGKDEESGVASTGQSLHDVGVMDLIRQDPRPTFILDLQSSADILPSIELEFCNQPLRKIDVLRDLFPAPSAALVSFENENEALTDLAGFREWVAGSEDSCPPRNSDYYFRGMLWTSITLRGRWRVVAVNSILTQPPPLALTNDSLLECSDDSDTKSIAQPRSRLENFKEYADVMPFGMCILSVDGGILYANEAWYEITGCEIDLEYPRSFLDVVAENDHSKFKSEWKTLMAQKSKRTFEYQLKDSSLDAAQKRILAAFDLEYDEEAKMKNAICCIMPISERSESNPSGSEQKTWVSPTSLQRNQETAKLIPKTENLPTGMPYSIKATVKGLSSPAPPKIPLQYSPAKESSDRNVNEAPNDIIAPKHSIKPHKLQILLVEDNIVNQKVYSKMLEKSGGTVYIASNGVETLNFLPNSTFWHERRGDGQGIDISIILMDIIMPLMDGFTCTRRIRELQQEGKIIGHVPIIGLTMTAFKADKEKAMEAGLDDTIVKLALSHIKLLHVITRLLARLNPSTAKL